MTRLLGLGHDVAAQREWLSGFTAAWSALPVGSEHDTVMDPRRGALSDVLVRALGDRPDLLTPLQEQLVEHLRHVSLPSGHDP